MTRVKARSESKLASWQDAVGFQRSTMLKSKQFAEHMLISSLGLATIGKYARALPISLG